MLINAVMSQAGLADGILDKDSAGSTRAMNEELLLVMLFFGLRRLMLSLTCLALGVDNEGLLDPKTATEPVAPEDVALLTEGLSLATSRCLKAPARVPVADTGRGGCL